MVHFERVNARNEPRMIAGAVLHTDITARGRADIPGTMLSVDGALI